MRRFLAWVTMCAGLFPLMALSKATLVAKGIDDIHAVLAVAVLAALYAVGADFLADQD